MEKLRHVEVLNSKRCRLIGELDCLQFTPAADVHVIRNISLFDRL